MRSSLLNPLRNLLRGFQLSLLFSLYLDFSVYQLLPEQHFLGHDSSSGSPGRSGGLEADGDSRRI
ncbi:hypothetical protein SLEP1_g36455 [Rubroshorea leprosula]|uniref:Uncharacterized protein n=1 Tax=Rubroshorea leprosula TaxID=152421 RepID=A0AAV5KS16_9ROSI|nr:hypothetical protein SLEP1_g36455 [Rubroshorea leprosula]